MSDWRDVPGCPGYEVSADGRVRRWRRRNGKVLYLRLCKRRRHERMGSVAPLRRADGRVWKREVWRVVASAFGEVSR